MHEAWGPASAAGGTSDPALSFGNPSTCTMSLIATGTPKSGGRVGRVGPPLEKNLGGTVQTFASIGLAQEPVGIRSSTSSIRSHTRSTMP